VWIIFFAAHHYTEEKKLPLVVEFAGYMMILWCQILPARSAYIMEGYEGRVLFQRTTRKKFTINSKGSLKVVYQFMSTIKR
jgi:hypothetical protein